MMKSILTDENDRCFICGSRRWLECHHIYGAANRKVSERNGFKVTLCHYCHNEPPDGVHHNIDRDYELRALCQQKYEETHSRQEFMDLIHKNFL